MVVGVIGEPKMKLIKEMKASPVDQMIPIGLVVGSEEDRRSEDSLKALCDAPVVSAVLRQPEKFQHLGGASETNGAAFLAEGERCYPNRNQPILAKGQAEIRMSDDVKEEASIPALINKLIFANWTQWNAAQHKWSGVECNFLFAPLALFPDKQDGVELLDSPGRDADLRQN